MINKVIKKLLGTARDSFLGCFWFSHDFIFYRKMLFKNKTKIGMRLFPQIFDHSPASHTFDKHYVYMDRWAFRQIQNSHPAEHVDVGSSIRFLSMASCVTQLKFVDIRPVRLDFDNFECIEGSILKLPFAGNSVQSLSCLHVAEHIGLGRYGDPLDPKGTEKACQELQRVLAPGGVLYFAVPIGEEITYFNAHRVFNPKTILDYFGGLQLQGFSAVSDQGHFISNANWQDFTGAHYACGMFKFTK